MNKFKLLDLYCCAGGAGEGYRLGGFNIMGVDIEHQPKNPHPFTKGDAIDFLRKHHGDFDAFHASPPCQLYSKSAKQWRNEGRKYPDLIEVTRKFLKRTGKPYIIENVPGSPLIDPVFLNGSVFNMRIHRPRYFESNFQIDQPEVPKMVPVKMGRPIKPGDILQPVGHFSGVRYAAQEMGLPWMGQSELAQAIPPAYTHYISKFLMKELTK